MAAKKATGLKPGTQRRARASSKAGKGPRSVRAKQPTNPGGDGYSEAEREEKRARILAELREIPLYWMAAAAAKVHPNTLAAWRRDDEGFDLECREARAEACKPYVVRLRSTDSATSAAAARYLEKVAPGEFKGEFVDDQLDRTTRPIRVTLVAREAAG